MTALTMCPMPMTGWPASLLQPVPPNYDTSFHLAWARDLLAGEGLDFSHPSSPTPHPLSLLMALVITPASADTAAGVVRAGSWVLAAALLGLLAWLTFEMTRHPWSAAISVVLAGSSAALGLLVLGGSSDVAYAALGAWGVVLSVRGRTSAATVVLLVAALLRPEAVLLAVVPVVLAWRGPDPRAGRTAAVVLAVGTVIAAGAWAGVGALGGEPLVSLRSAAENAAVNDNPRGPLVALVSVLPGLAGPTGWCTIAVAGAAVASATARRTRTRFVAAPRAVRVVAVFVLVSVAAFLGQGLLGTPLVARYLLLPALLCLALASSGVAVVSRALADRARAARLAAATSTAVVLVAAAGVTVAPAWADVTAATRTRSAVLVSAHELTSDGLLRDCPGPVVVRSPAMVALTALELGRPLRLVEVGDDPGSGVLLQPLSAEAAELAGYGPMTPLAEQSRFPADAPPRAQSTHWALYSRCTT